MLSGRLQRRDSPDPEVAEAFGREETKLEAKAEPVYQLRSRRAQALRSGQLAGVMSGGSWVLSRSPVAPGFFLWGQDPAEETVVLFPTAES